ncbi:MAG: IS66 family transposase [Parachlamydiales bacterium]|jgi:transposase
MNLSKTTTFEELKKLVFLLNDQNTSLQNQNTFLQEKNSQLEEQLNWLKKQLFGKKSEREIPANPDQLIFNGFEDIEVVEQTLKTVKAHSRKDSKKDITKITVSPDIPVKTVTMDIPESEKICKTTGIALKRFGEEVSIKLIHKPGSYYIQKTIRPKYALPNGEGVKMVSLPDSVIPKCRVDEGILADIITKKYADHLPLYRISEEFARDGIGIPRQLLSKWMIKIGLALKPLYNEIKKRILSSNNVFIDETPIAMQDSPKVKTAFLWVMAGGKEKDPFYRIYDFKLNRNHENAQELLKDYHGVVHSDKYGAYVRMAEQKLFEWCPCWVHIRRKFIESQTDPNFTNYMLRKIKYLFMFERIAWGRPEEERLKIRREKEIPIIDELIASVKNKLHDRHILPKSKLKEALGYFYSLIPYLKNYTKFPYARIDNNTAERAVRPIAIGRKNWLFVGSEDAGEACAVLLSLTQTYRALNINPREYFDDMLRRFMGHSFSKLYELLPDEWLKSRSISQ